MTKKSWFNGHAHTYYSFLDGYSRPLSYAERAVELGMTAAVITDHGHVHGWPEHEEACKQAGIKPVFGIEAYQARKSRFDMDAEERSGPATMEWDQRGPYHLTIMAKDLVGYNNIIKLSSKAYLEGYYVKPRLDIELIAEHSDGLVVMSGCLGGQVQQALLLGNFEGALKAAQTMQDIVGKENYFIELHDHGIPEQLQVKDDLIKIAKMIGAKLAPSADCHYVEKEDYLNHDALLCVQTKATIAQEERFKFANDEFYLKSREEMEQHFEPEWLDNTLLIGEMCNVEITRGEYHFPKFQPPEGKDRQEFFEEIVWTGVKEQYGDPIPEDIVERVLYETRVITESGFVPYFLIVWDIVNWAKNQGIRVGKGRGSVTGSVVSFVMGITGIDPMKYDLLFERFLIEGRASMPDIDLDFDDRRRDEVVAYVREKYGADHIANIVTLSSIKARSAIQDAGRVLGYDFPTVNKLANFVPPPVNGVTKTLDECMQDADFLETYHKDPDAKKIIDVARGLEGVYRQTGVHASGILITDNPVIEYVPVMQKNLKDGTRGPVVTQWVGEEIDRNGLLKIDFLGLANLSMIDICVENVKKFRGIDIDVDNLPLDDRKTYELYHEGATIGCFQVAGEGMRGLMKDMKPDNIKDIMALVSLFRPGPMGPGMHKMYVNRKHGRAPLDFVHPLLREDLEDTYGVFVYQENLLTAARVLAGFNPAEADDLRKAMGKKKPEVMAKLKEKFIQGCADTNNMPRHMADSIFTDIEYFAGYGFGKGHAAAYAELSYTTAYLKANYPVEYMCAALDSSTHGKTDLDAMREYLAEATRMGLKVLPPSVTKSGPTFDVSSEDEILFGLSGIGGIGGAIISALVTDDSRKNWKSIGDMFAHAEKAVLNKGTFEKFLFAGALDDLLPDIEEDDITELDIIKTLSLEKNALGLFVTDNPVDRLSPVLKAKSSHAIADVNNINQRTRVKIAGMIDRFEERKTRAGKKMWTFTLEDGTGSINGFCYDTIIAELGNKLENNKFYILEAAAAFDRADPSVRNLVLYNFEEINLESLDMEPSIDIVFSEEPTSDLMNKIVKLLDKSRGKSKLKIIYNIDGIRYDTLYKHKVNNSVKESIDKLIAMSQVEVWD